MSPQRQVVLTFLDLSSWNHYMFTILDVDVTLARQLIDGHEARTGESLSFTGFLTHCLARAVAEDPTVQAYLKGRKRLVMFDDVDVGLMVERGAGGARAPVGYVVLRANQKDVLEIHREIRAVQTAPPRTGAEIPAWLRVMPHLPGALGGSLVALVRAAKRHDPARMWVPMAGTVALANSRGLLDYDERVAH